MVLIVMTGRLVLALAAGLLLGGCCHDGVGYSHSSALAQLRPIAKPRHPKQPKPQVASTDTATPKDFPVGEDELIQTEDDELKMKLVICRGCEDRLPNVRANSVWPKSAASHLTVDQV